MEAITATDTAATVVYVYYYGYEIKENEVGKM
jgi:hypothetical protein